MRIDWSGQLTVGRPYRWPALAELGAARAGLELLSWDRWSDGTDVIHRSRLVKAP